VSRLPGQLFGRTDRRGLRASLKTC
jgi:hypothetical protein